MIWAFLKATSFGIPRWVLALAGLVLILLAAYVYLTRAEEADDRANQEIGATVEREKNLNETVERVKEANDVREEVNRNDDVGAELRYRQCLRSARTPANCERFLPQRQAD
jgi:hypothetical protein